MPIVAVHKGLSHRNLKNAGEDVDHDLVASLNERGSYPLQLVGDRDEILTITNIRAIFTEQTDAVAQELAQADFICQKISERILVAMSKSTLKMTRNRDIIRAMKRELMDILV